MNQQTESVCEFRCPCGIEVGVVHVCAHGMKATGKAWLCPYCNEAAYEGGIDATRDKFNGVCHSECLAKERRIAARMEAQGA